MTKDYEYRLKKKEDEIQELKRKIEEMSAEFAKMLKVIHYYFGLWIILLTQLCYCFQIGYFGQDARENWVSSVGFWLWSSNDEKAEGHDWSFQQLK